MRVYLICILSVLVTTISAQEKRAYLYSSFSGKTNNEKLIAVNDLMLVREALLNNDFTSASIIIDTISKVSGFPQQIDKISSGLKKKDFLFVYADTKRVSVEAGSTNHDFPTNNDQHIIYKELLDKIKINDPASIFLVFNGSFIYDSKKQNIKTPVNALFATNNERNINTAINSVFAISLANALSNGSINIESYADLLNEIERQVLLHTTRQHPVLLFNGHSQTLFNNLFLKKPVHFQVQSQKNEMTLVINAGENISILPGTDVNFYAANTLNTKENLITRGVVEKSTEFNSEVRLTKPFTGNHKSLWALIGANENRNPVPQSISFNINFPQSGNAVKNKFFNAILKEIKENPKLSAYINPVNEGGNLAINDIGLMTKDSISCTIVNVKTGEPLREFFYATKNEKLTYDKNELDKYSELEEYLINTAEWQFLSKLNNTIPRLQVDAVLKSTNGKTQVNNEGYTLINENDELTISLSNPGNTRIYFSVIDLKADRNSKILFPVLGESGSTYFVEPGKTFITEAFPRAGIYGHGKLKIITSATAIDLNELREKDILTRKKQEGSFFPEYVNVQDLDYEVRSSLYTLDRSIVKKLIKIDFAGDKLNFYNRSGQRIYFNVLEHLPDGSYATRLPDKQYPESECQVNAMSGASFIIPNKSLAGNEMITLISDRPFLLSRYETENTSINNLLVSIIRSGKIPGSPLNKITVAQQLVTEKEVAASRGNSVAIKLISPKINADRNTPLIAAVQEFTLNGFALTEENKAVQTVKVNGQSIDYDKDLKFFDKVLLLAGGRNKIVIEAIDDKGFSGTQIVEVDYPKPDSVVQNVNPVNYFLGIAIDDYRTWPPLSNAKNDVINFSNLLNEKFGYQPANFTTLFDTAATRKNIIRQIRSYLVKVKPNDNVIIYFSGHGNKDQLTDGDYYFIPCDGEPDDISSAVKSTDIMDNFKNIRAKNCLLIMDACFSGLISNSVYAGQKMSLVNSDKNPAELPSKWILTSGRATKVSDGIPGTNSPFASVMINYLRETEDQSKLTISKLLDYLKDNVPKFNRQQIPFGMSISGEGELPFKITSK